MAEVLPISPESCWTAPRVIGQINSDFLLVHPACPGAVDCQHK